MTKKKVFLIILITVCALGILGFGVYKIFGATALYPIFALREGNSSKYNIENVEEITNSPIKEKSVLFLGSSVTKGYGSCGTSFADYFAEKYDIFYLKEAVSGTTIAHKDETSYSERMSRNHHGSIHYDAIVCQLSTNDATQNIPIDEVKAGINSILHNAKAMWDCPVIFFTNPRYDSEPYEKMVEALYEIQKENEEYDIIIIDLWNDREFNDITEEERKLYMLDEIHPTKAGYLEWWLPKFEKIIVDTLTKTD